MPTVPVLQQSVQSTTDASVWTSVGGGIYQTELSVTLISPTLSNTIVLEACLACLDPSFESNFTEFFAIFSDGIVYDDPSGGAGTFTTGGNVNALWLLLAAFIDPDFAPPGDVTINILVRTVGVPASPLIFTAVATEYSNLKDEYGAIGLMDIVPGANTGSSLSITDGYGGTQPGDNFYVGFGVAVNQTTDILASSPFVTETSATGLPNTSSSVYADLYSSTGESITLSATGSSGDYGLGGTIGAFDIVCACQINGSPTTISPGDPVVLTWTSNPYTLTASIDNGIGSVAVNGSTTVNPLVTTTYILSVTGPTGSTNSSSVTITVNPGAPPTANLTISSIPVSGLPVWQPNTQYSQADLGTYQSLIIDPNGNYQAILTGGGGKSGVSIPSTWASAAGATTPDGTATWTCVIPLDSSGNDLPYSLAVVKLGTTVGLTWSSTNGTSATITGTVPLNGSGTYTPDLTLIGTTTIYLGVPGNPDVGFMSFACPQYTFTVTGPGGTTTSIVYFALFDPISIAIIDSFAPVNVAEDSDNGGTAGGGAAVSLPLTPWSPATQYNTGDSVLDSNGSAQVALNPGTSYTSPPVWAVVGDVTTETGGLEWENYGQIYPGAVTQTGFGPLWDGGQSTLGFGWEDMVIPSFVVVPSLAYTASTAYTAGQVVSIKTATPYFEQTGIQELLCIQDGTTGPTDPSVINTLPYRMPGQIVSDNAINGGGTVIWKVLGSLLITLNWVGTQNHAPDGYPAPGSPSGSGNLPLTFDGTTQSYALNTPTLISDFLSNPATQDPTVYIFNTATIPATGMPPSCPSWVSLALGTGYINTGCVDGATVTIGGAWAEFSVPVTPLPPSTGTITIIKATLPSTSVESFTFTPDWGGGTFALSNGQSNNSGPLPPGTYSVIETPVDGWETIASQDLSSIVLNPGQNIIITVTNTQVPPIPARVLPYLKIPTGQGQSVDELNGQSSISALTVECIDKSNELKYLATKVEVIGKNIYFKMGFPGMNLSDFVPLHVAQITDVGRSTDGWMRFSCRDNLSVLDRALWFCGGPQPVALPWLYGQRYLAGQYVQDSNGNIEQCVVGGTSSSTQPPIWPGTTAPVWEPNTSYTLGYYAIDNLNGNLQAVTTVPSGHTSTRPINTGVSGNGFPNPPWGNTVGSITLDNSGSNVNGPISWTLIAINTTLGITVTDNDITWQIVAKPNQGAFGGSQAFYVYSLFGQDTGTPTPPATYAWQSNQYPTLDSNPRYIQLNPIDAFLVALQNELGVGQSPLLPPIVTTDPNDPSNALVFAPNPAWQQYNPGDDSTLINPNPFLDIPRILAVRDNQCSGQRFEWNVKRPVTAKQWIENEIMHPLGLYMFIGADGRIGLNSMAPSPTPNIEVLDQNRIVGTPDEAKLPIVNVVTVRCDVDDEGAYSAARVYDAEMTFAQQTSLATYLQEFSHSVESNGLRLAYDSYGVAYLFSDRVFRRHGFGTPEYTIECYLSEIRMELGDYFLLSHPLMMDYKSSTGQLGIQNVLCEIMDKQPNYAQGRVTFKAWDTRFMNTTAPIYITPAADSVPNWTSASAAQQKKYMFVSYWPGRYSDGDEGNEIF